MTPAGKMTAKDIHMRTAWAVAERCETPLLGILSADADDAKAVEEKSMVKGWRLVW